MTSEIVKIVTPLQNHKFLDSWYELSNENHFWFRWRVKAFLQQLNDLKIPLQKDWKVLDIGCGTGILQKQIESATNWTVDSTDLDYQALCHAEQGRGQIMYYDIIEKNPEFKEKYDAVILFDVIEHIEDTDTFIESVLFHIKKDGFLFVNVPALQSLFSRYDEVQGHFRRYNKIEINQEFNNFPMKTLDIRYWGLINIPLILARKIFLASVHQKKSKEQIFRQGFEPPNNLINSCLIGLMNCETFFIKKPIKGSSVLWAGQKKG
jgi:2-polyprenyl-3-methyl-5-hydroxy-6-metoxy-1,4-benzoquinol methylase